MIIKNSPTDLTCTCRLPSNSTECTISQDHYIVQSLLPLAGKNIDITMIKVPLTHS